MKSTLRLAVDQTRPVPRRATFTIKALEAVKPPVKGDLTVWDTKVPGLCLRVRASGAKTFYFRKKFKGRAVRVSLGTFPEATVEQVRKAALAELQKANSGIDPAADRRTARGELTIGELWDIYLTTHLNPRCSPRTVAQDTWLFNRHLASVKSRRLSDLTPAAAKALHVRIAESSKTSANRSIQLLKRLYRFAVRHHGYEGSIPTVAVEMFRERSRERFLSVDELPKFLAAADTEGQPWADFFRLCLFIGARRSNIQMMRWKDIDMQAGVWTIPGDESKNGKSMALPLTSEAMKIISKRKSEQEQSKNERINNSEYVFPAIRVKGERLYLSQPARPFARICKRAGITGITIHDLRRTAGAWMAANGASLPLIGKMLGHADLRATQIYARLDLTPVRAAMESATAAMGAAVSKPKVSKVR